MPEVYVYTVEGRSVDEKRGLVRDITDAVVKNFKAKQDRVIVQIVESPRHNKASGGVLLSELLPPSKP
jgi:4-oxalocrotonate tautomerase